MAALSTWFVLLTVAGCGLLYGAHRNQQWRRAPLGRTGAAAGALLLAAGLACAWLAWTALAAVLAWLMLLMLACSLAPFTSLLRGRRNET